MPKQTKLLGIRWIARLCLPGNRSQTRCFRALPHRSHSRLCFWCPKSASIIYETLPIINEQVLTQVAACVGLRFL